MTQRVFVRFLVCFVVRGADRVKNARRTERAHARHTRDKCDRAADQTDQRQHEARRAQTAGEACLFCVARADQTNDAQNDRHDRGVAKEPQRHGNNAEHEAGDRCAVTGLLIAAALRLRRLLIALFGRVLRIVLIHNLNAPLYKFSMGSTPACIIPNIS